MWPISARMLNGRRRATCSVWSHAWIGSGFAYGGIGSGTLGARMRCSSSFVSDVDAVSGAERSARSCALSDTSCIRLSRLALGSTCLKSVALNDFHDADDPKL